MLPQCACLLSYLGSVYLLHQSADSLVTPHRFVRLLFGKTSQNWCSCGVVPQMLLEIRSKFHRTCVLILCFTAQSASSLGIFLIAKLTLVYPCKPLENRLSRILYTWSLLDVFLTFVRPKDVIRLKIRLFILRHVLPCQTLQY